MRWRGRPDDLSCPVHLGCEPIGDPVVRAVGSQETLDHGAAAIGMDDETGAVGVVEHPGPPGLLANPYAGLVGLQDGAGEQPGADQAGLPGEGIAAVGENIDQRAFADIHAEEIGEQLGQPFEPDRLGEAQIERESPQIGAERRSRLQPLRRLRLEPFGAARTHTAQQGDAGDIRFDLGNFDAVIGFADALRRSGDIGAAVLAVCRRHLAMRCRVGMERAMRARVRLGLGLGIASLDALRPCEGGVLEFSGVFGGRSSFSRSAAFSASTVASRWLKSSTRPNNSSTHANNDAISASFSALDNAEESRGGLTHTLTHIRALDATPITRNESICRIRHTEGLSNYHCIAEFIRKLPHSNALTISDTPDMRQFDRNLL